MKLLQMQPAELRRQLAGSGILMRTGPFSLKLQSRIPSVVEGLAQLYGQFEVRSTHEAFADCHVSVNPPSTLSRWLRPQAAFSFDGLHPFKPLPRDQAFPMLEWGLNWCVRPRRINISSSMPRWSKRTAWPPSSLPRPARAKAH